MPTKNPRINITLEPKVVSVLKKIAEHENKSIAALSRELLLEGLEYREDISLSTLAEARDTNKNQKHIDHDDAWK